MSASMKTLREFSVVLPYKVGLHLVERLLNFLSVTKFDVPKLSNRDHVAVVVLKTSDHQKVLVQSSVAIVQDIPGVFP